LCFYNGGLNKITGDRLGSLIKEDTPKPPATLGDVLYAKSRPPVPEQDWVALVRATASGDQLALYALYDMAHRPVFTLIMRITANLRTAEELTVDVFHDLWRRAARYDVTEGTVLGWIMNRARWRAIDRLSFESRKKLDHDDTRPPAADPRDVLELRRQGESLRAALTALTAEERRAIETTFFAGRTQADAAARLNQAPGTVVAHLRSGLRKLRHVLTSGVMSIFHEVRCDRSELACAYAAQALAPDDAVALEAHIASCQDCRRELESLRPVIDRFVSWPTDVLRPPRPLQARLARCIAEETGRQPAPLPQRRWVEPEWEEVAPGIECKLLATDTERRWVSMQVRLAPGASYPAHTHAGPEELHLLDGELWIDGRKLVPGDYNYGAPGEGDESVYSETGCTCILVTSIEDVLH
jgi:RNA polymerase sigma factor (sigma-70 family)